MCLPYANRSRATPCRAMRSAACLSPRTGRVISVSMSNVSAGAEQISARKNTAVRVWLLCVAGLIAAMVVVGGATRLTDSGLSITEWQPILGAIPPLNRDDWMAAFELYKQIPEYQVVNRGMSLEEFKYIYWWEWGHRFLGRFIGIAVLVPLLFFWLRGYLTRPLGLRLIVVFLLGGAQGALGWYMVKSGLADRVDVSQYRLAAHLGFAVILFAYVLWLILRLGRGDNLQRAPMFSATGVTALAGVGLIFLQIVAGGFVAGLDAGQGYNTWPLMDGRVIPHGLFVMSPAWLNIFENAMTVQFLHRVLAYVVVIYAGLLVSWSWNVSDRALRTTSLIVFFVVLVQVGLGIATLLGQVPISLALVHQLAALVVLGVALSHLHVSVYGSGYEKSPT